ncbi:MAG: hypothetical protein HDS13_06100 [Bacteroides sp.]|nr:hypothetical protein [Bacteroides sp.]
MEKWIDLLIFPGFAVLLLLMIGWLLTAYLDSKADQFYDEGYKAGKMAERQRALNRRVMEVRKRADRIAREVNNLKRIGERADGLRDTMQKLSELKK